MDKQVVEGTARGVGFPSPSYLWPFDPKSPLRKNVSRWICTDFTKEWRFATEEKLRDAVRQKTPVLPFADYYGDMEPYWKWAGCMKKIMQGMRNEQGLHDFAMAEHSWTSARHIQSEELYTEREGLCENSGNRFRAVSLAWGLIGEEPHDLSDVVSSILKDCREKYQAGSIDKGGHNAKLSWLCSSMDHSFETFPDRTVLKGMIKEVKANFIP